MFWKRHLDIKLLKMYLKWYFNFVGISRTFLLGLIWDVVQTNQNLHHWLQIDLVTSCSRRLTTFVILLIILVEHHGGILEKLFFLPYFCLPFPMAQFFSWKNDLSYLVAYTSCNLAKINCHVFLASSSSSYSECDVFLDDAFFRRYGNMTAFRQIKFPWCHFHYDDLEDVRHVKQSEESFVNDAGFPLILKTWA